jgi:hypothetical protein
VLAGHVHA